MVGFTPSLLLHVLRGNWAHFWCPKIVRSVRSLCPPRRFIYFARALPRRWHHHPQMSQALTSTVFYPCALMFLCPAKVGPNMASVVPPRWPGTPLQVPWGCAPRLVTQRHFLVEGAGPALAPPADRALCRAFSAHGCFIRCTAACSQPGRGEIALQRPPLASAGAAGRTVSPRKSPASTVAASPAILAPARPPTLQDQTPPRSSGPPVHLDTDSPSRGSLRVGCFQGLIVGPSGAAFSSMRHLGCLATPPLFTTT
ncbi:hypothetical protein NDU88_005760 [Pleurodeles waltl]|uniref:Uncharacterized protein n=1 Tax=Pleurodeles waltl TaxID=8319 RepID=A0AAV7SMU6_PLEWA|nr:hypothetical protein NDU88_005760 [Pleurodeles waltl]